MAEPLLSCFRPLILVSLLTLAPVSVEAEDVTVFAAASLKTALDQIATEWQAATGNGVVISYAGSSQLAQQIEAGAPADIFISAAVDWMDTLETAGRIVPESRVDLVGNSLVLVAFDAAVAPVTISPDLDLAGMLGDGKLATALVDAVPAGVYGKEALTTLGLWDNVGASVAQAENVRAALALVATGEAPFGIVYTSDAVAEPGVSVIGTFPSDSHAPIIFPAALIADSTAAAAADFLDYLSSDPAKAVFEAQGFVTLD
jgi:molybdate transport system substrate-binding protein